MTLLTLADDFTGALDTGVQFAAQGITTIVAAQHDVRPESLSPAQNQVVVCNMSSRHLPPEQAASRVRTAVARFADYKPDYFYKKTDSLLRGNVGPELAALIEAAGGKDLMFVPAYPQTGRRTVGGVQQLHETPIHLTSFAADRLNPIRESYIPRLLGTERFGIKAVTVHMDDVNRGEIPAQEAGDRNVIFIFDSATEHDLDAVGELLAESCCLRLTAGCAGFAAVLPGVIGLPARPHEPVRLEGPVLVLSGSRTELALRQKRRAQRHGFFLCELTLEERLVPDLADTPRGARIAAQIAGRLKEKQNCILSTAESDRAGEKALAARQGLGEQETAHRVAVNLARLTAAVMEQCLLKSLVVVGGDTAAALVESLGIEALVPLQELLPGVPVSAVPQRGLTLITKSGGFGGESTIVDLSRLCTI